MRHSRPIDVDGVFLGAAVEHELGVWFVAVDVRVSEMDQSISPTVDYAYRSARQLFKANTRLVVSDIRRRVAAHRRNPDDIVVFLGHTAVVGRTDELIAWVEEAGVDGFNLSRIVTPETLEDFVELVVPILQERGVYKREYVRGPLRQKLFGRARLPGTHPAAAHRRPGRQAQQSAAE
jgi:hypothetical protein